MKSHNRSVVAFYVAVLQIVLKDSIKTRYDRMYKYTKEWNVLSFAHKCLQRMRRVSKKDKITKNYTYYIRFSREKR